jgi:hypothetical protein
VKPSWEVLKPLRWRTSPGEALRALSAGSGLARIPGGFWAVADDLNHLIRIPDGKGAGSGHRIFPGEPPVDAARRKRVKKDLESLIDLGGGRLVAFPSGSKDRRCRGSVIRLSARGRFKGACEIDFRPLMDLLAEVIPDLNIEGGYVSRRRLILLQRGNGKSGFNGVVKIRLKGFLKGLEGRWRASALRIRVKRVPLGRWGSAALSFSDGFFHDGVAYFSAAAEGGGDTYRDGRIFGSVVGALPKGGRPVILARLKGEKIEGLALKSVKDDLLEICAVTDADNPRRPSRLLRTWIRKPA